MAVYQVTVTVLDSTNNRPIEGAIVAFSWIEGGRERSVSKVTDSQGKAVFELAPRSYSLTVSKDDYAIHSETVTIDRPGMNITVKLNPLPETSPPPPSQPSPPQPAPEPGFPISRKALLIGAIAAAGLLLLILGGRQKKDEKEQ